MWVRLKHNWGYKVFAFFTAILLWIYVRTQQNPIVTQEVKREVEVKGLAPGLILTSPLPTVNLLIRAPKKRLEQIDLNSINAEISLDGREEGSYEVPIKVSVPKGVSVSYKLKNVRVVLDRIISQEVAVQPVISTPPPEGFSLAGIYLNPTNVLVYYPSSQKGNLSGVQVFVDLSKGEGDVMLPVLAVDKQGKPMANSRVVPPLVKVSVSLKATKAVKILPIVPDFVGSLPNNLVLEKVEVYPQVVSVTGPTALLGELSNVKTEKIDLSKIESSCSLEVPLSKIDRVTYLDVTKATVHIYLKLGSGGQ